MLCIERGEHLVDGLGGAEELVELLTVLRQQVRHEEDLRFGDQRAGKAGRLVDELQDASLCLLHRVYGFTQGAVWEELNFVVGVRFDFFFELLGVFALHFVQCFFEGIAPCVCRGRACDTRHGCEDTPGDNGLENSHITPFHLLPAQHKGRSETNVLTVRSFKPIPIMSM